MMVVNAPSGRIVARNWGPVDGDPVVLVHGFPDTVSSWEPVAEILAAAGHRVIAPSLVGYAPSSALPGRTYPLEPFSDDIFAVCGQAGNGRPVALVGHDWGAFAVYALAGRDQAVIDRFVAMAVPPPAAVLAARGRLALRQLRNSWYTIFFQLPWLPEQVLPRLVPWLWRQWSPGLDGRAAADEVLRTMDAGGGLAYYRAQPAAFADRARRALILGRPQRPVLYIHGVDDGCVDVGLARLAEGHLPEPSRIELITGAGHFAQLERPDTVAELILGWINR